MAKFSSSPFGNIKQTIGDTVAYASRGQNIIRTRASSYKDLNSLSQRRNRAALKMAAGFAASFKGLLPVSFPSLQPGRTAFSEFIGRNHAAIKAAIVQDAGTGTVDDMIENVGFAVTELTLSQGNLSGDVQIDEIVKENEFALGVNVTVDENLIEQNPNAIVYAGFYDTVTKRVKFKAGSELTNGIQIVFDGRLPSVGSSCLFFCFAVDSGKSTAAMLSLTNMPAS